MLVFNETTNPFHSESHIKRIALLIVVNAPVPQTQVLFFRADEDTFCTKLLGSGPGPWFTPPSRKKMRKKKTIFFKPPPFSCLWPAEHEPYLLHQKRQYIHIYLLLTYTVVTSCRFFLDGHLNKQLPFAHRVLHRSISRFDLIQ